MDQVSVPMTHKELVHKASRWLKAIGCTVVIEELTTVCPETPDSIGWRDTLSIVVECKVSRSDFLHDKKKWCRMPCSSKDALGDWRFFMCPHGIIQPPDLLASSWGLLYVEALHKRIKRVIGPKGNAGWHPSPFQGNKKSESILLVSALRRLTKGRIFRSGVTI